MPEPPSAATTQLEFLVLGPLEVWRGGARVRLGGERQRALLVLLLLNANEVVPSDRLIEQLFRNDASERAANALQVAISRLRRVLENGDDVGATERVLVTRAPGYALRADRDQLDIARFESLTASGRQSLLDGDPATAAATLRAALGLWRGPPLADVALLEFAQPEIRRLEELRLTALTERIEADLALGRGAELVPELEALVATDPLQERLRGQLMLALYRSGRQADALEVYRRTRALLREELGLEPSRALQSLERSILVHDMSLDVGVDDGAVRRRQDGAVCPFKGLASYEQADAAYFFGRERVIAELVSRHAEATLVGLLGASGAGKSSILRAGLLPALASGALPGSARWRAVVLRPGEHPCAELRRVLGGVDLQTAVGSLHGDERLVLAVDQLEEVFTAGADERERARFLDTLADAALDADRRVSVVVTLRADAYGATARHPRFAELLSREHVLVGPMHHDELARAIALPANRAGLEVESGLVEALVADVVDEPGGLPLLSTALLELWRDRSGNVLRLDVYRASGGVRRAVARLAEDVYRRLTEPERGMARAVMLRLVAGEGDNVIRERVPRTDLDGDGRFAAVLDALVAARLVTVSDGAVEIAHEALPREWPRFRDWLEQDRDGRRLHRHLIDSARDWDERGRDSADVYRGARLAAALDWASTHHRDLNDVERAFLTASRRAGERSLRRLRVVAAALAALLALAIIAGIVAFSQRQSAQREARAAFANRLAVQAVAEPRLDRALLLAREAVALDDTPQTQGALLATLLRSPAAPRKTFTVPEGTRPLRISVSPDGQTLAASDNTGQIRWFDTGTRRESRPPLTDAMGYLPPVYSDDGTTLLTIAAGEPPPGLQRLDSTTLERIRLLPFDRVWLSRRGGAVTPFGLSTDGKLAFFAYDVVVNEAEQEGAAYLDVWDVRTGRLSTRPLGSNDVVAARLLDDESRLMTVTRTEIATWDTRTLRKLASARPRVELGGYADISPDGRLVASLRASGPVVAFVDARTGVVARGRGAEQHGGALTVRFSPDGSTLATSHQDGALVLWEPEAGRAFRALEGHGGAAVGAVWSSDGSVVYSSSLDGSILEWGVGDTGLARAVTVGPPIPSLPNVPQTPPLAVAPDGSRFAVRLGRSQVAIHETRTLRRLLVLGETGGAPVTTVAWSPEGRVLAVGRRDGPVQVWSTDRARLVRLLHGLEAVQALSFAPEGNLLAGVDIDRTSGSKQSTGRLVTWRTDTGASPAEPIALERPGTAIAFTPDGRTIAVGLDDGRVQVVDALASTIERSLRPRGAPNVAVAFAPDGTLLTGSWAGVVQRWHPADGTEIGTGVLAAAGPVADISYGPRADRFATAGLADGRVKLWTSTPFQPLASSLPNEKAPAANVAMTNDGRHLVVAYDDGTAAVWPISVDDWAARACSIAGRNLTRNEWSQYLPSREYRRTCRNGD